MMLYRLWMQVLSAFGRVGLLTVESHTALHTETGVLFDVTLDGVLLPLRNVIEADDTAGIVRVIRRDANGMAYKDPETDHAAEESRRGRVRFVARRSA